MDSQPEVSKDSTDALPQSSTQGAKDLFSLVTHLREGPTDPDDLCRAISTKEAFSLPNVLKSYERLPNDEYFWGKVLDEAVSLAPLEVVDWILKRVKPHSMSQFYLKLLEDCRPMDERLAIWKLAPKSSWVLCEAAQKMPNALGEAITDEYLRVCFESKSDPTLLYFGFRRCLTNHPQLYAKLIVGLRDHPDWHRFVHIEPLKSRAVCEKLYEHLKGETGKSDGLDNLVRILQRILKAWRREDLNVHRDLGLRPHLVGSPYDCSNQLHRKEAQVRDVIRFVRLVDGLETGTIHLETFEYLVQTDAKLSGREYFERDTSRMFAICPHQKMGEFVSSLEKKMELSGLTMQVFAKMSKETFSSCVDHIEWDLPYFYRLMGAHASLGVLEVLFDKFGHEHYNCRVIKSFQSEALARAEHFGLPEEVIAGFRASLKEGQSSSF